MTECEHVNTPSKLAAMGLEEKGWTAGFGLGDHSVCHKKVAMLKTTVALQVSVLATNQSAPYT